MCATRDDDLVEELKRDGYLPSDFPANLKSGRSDEAKMADEETSIRLLAGYDVKQGKNVRPPTHFSDEEREMRAALARCIRDQMTGIAGELLALAVDPFTPSSRPHMRPAAKIKFMRQGRPSTLMIENRVIDFIRRQRFNSETPQAQKVYIAAAMKEFGLEYNTVHAIWSAHEKMVDEARQAGPFASNK